MWFKNLIVYQFSQSFETTAEQLEKKLSKKAFRGCGSQDLSSYGWVSPLGKNSALFTHSQNGFVMVTARQEDKILPASVLREALEEKIEQIEHEQDRRVFNKEKKALKDDLLMAMLPKAFTRSQLIYAYIDIQQGWLVVDSSSFKKAEALTAFLRETLGSLPIQLVPLKQAPATIMTQWLAQKRRLPKQFSLGDECELREIRDEGGRIRISKQALVEDELDVHLNVGKQVSKLALQWDDSFSFVLSDDFVIRKLKFSDAIQDKLNQDQAETAAEQFDADFAMMTVLQQQLINALIKGLGGLV